jgi:tricarballylate dehydrogenase
MSKPALHTRFLTLPVPGLYAAGETVGILYGEYIGAATSVLRALVFGRQAGIHAAR